MESIYAKIKRLRLEKGISQGDLADATGYTSRSSIAKIEAGDVDLPQSKIQLFAKALKVTPQFLLGLSDTTEGIAAIEHLVSIPVYSPISCGTGAFVDDEIIDYVSIPDSKIKSADHYFGQYAAGNSMINAGIVDGDILIFEKTESLSNGQIGCFSIEDNVVTCKRFSKSGNTIILNPANDRYEPIIIQADNEQFKIVGRLSFVISDRRFA
ncbi:MAG: LexA family protein [Anaerorhabdus sp.]